MSPRPSVMGPMKSSPPNDRHVAGLTLLSVIDATVKARHRRNLILSRRLKNGSAEPHSLSSAMIESSRSIPKRLTPMLDKPEKTRELIDILDAAVPFEVELMPSAIALLRAQHIADNVKPTQTVLKVSYAGDEGGILCHIEPEERVIAESW